MTLRKNLYIGIGLLIIIMLIISISGIFGLSYISKTVNNMLTTESRISEYSSRARANINAMRRYEKDLFINFEKPDKVESYFKKWNNEYNSGKNKTSLMLEIYPNNEEILLMSNKLEEYRVGFDTVVDRLKGGAILSTQQANIEIGKYKKAIHDMEDIAKDHSYKATESFHQLEDKVVSINRFVIFSEIGYLLIGIIIAFFCY